MCELLKWKSARTNLRTSARTQHGHISVYFKQVETSLWPDFKRIKVSLWGWEAYLSKAIDFQVATQIWVLYSHMLRKTENIFTHGSFNK